MEVSLMLRPPKLGRLGLHSGFILLQKHHWTAKWDGEGRVPSLGGGVMRVCTPIRKAEYRLQRE